MEKSYGSVVIDTISDGYDDGGVAKSESTEAYFRKFQQVGSATLSKLIEKLEGFNCKANCLVYDAFLTLALDAAKRFGLVGAVLFTRSCSVDNIYYHVYKGLLKLPLLEKDQDICLPGLLLIKTLDMPSFITINDFGSFSAVFDMVVNQFANIEKACSWVPCNNFDVLKEEVSIFMSNLLPLKTIRPAMLSIYLDKQIEDEKEYGLTMYKPDSDANYMKWLNEQPNESVIYVSFCSMAQLEVVQVEELCLGLKRCNGKFLWVVRESEQIKLPMNFREGLSDNGLVRIRVN